MGTVLNSGEEKHISLVKVFTGNNCPEKNTIAPFFTLPDKVARQGDPLVLTRYTISALLHLKALSLWHACFLRVTTRVITKLFSLDYSCRCFSNKIPDTAGETTVRICASHCSEAGRPACAPAISFQRTPGTMQKYI